MVTGLTVAAVAVTAFLLGCVVSGIVILLSIKPKRKPKTLPEQIRYIKEQVEFFYHAETDTVREIRLIELFSRVSDVGWNVPELKKHIPIFSFENIFSEFYLSNVRMVQQTFNKLILLRESKTLEDLADFDGILSALKEGMETIYFNYGALTFNGSPLTSEILQTLEQKIYATRAELTYIAVDKIRDCRKETWDRLSQDIQKAGSLRAVNISRQKLNELVEYCLTNEFKHQVGLSSSGISIGC